jgi:hypothetical protein
MIPNQIRNVVMTTLLSATVALVPGVSRSQDQPLDKRTVLTFSGPVALPGVALQPGQYVFRLADPSSSRKLIQVVSVDGKQVYGTFFSVPLDRAEAPSKPEIRFMEAAPGSPAPVRAYWWANERTGSEFIYPREQALRLAKSAKEPVLTTTASASKVDDANTGSLTRVSSSGQDSASNATASSTNQRLGQDQIPAPGSVTPSGSNPGDRTPRQMAQNRTALPQTASSRPGIAVLGMLALALACAMRAWSMRIN